MQEKIRPATSADWPEILVVADQVHPFSNEDNREWWYERQHFETRDYRRRHYVVEAPPAIASRAGKAPALMAYGSIEEGPEDNHYRVFLVMAPELIPTLGEQLYMLLVKDLSELHAEVAWAREETVNPVLDFYRKKGFIDQLRINLSNGREGLLLAKRLE
jgi:hypothetical protein